MRWTVASSGRREALSRYRKPRPHLTRRIPAALTSLRTSRVVSSAHMSYHAAACYPPDRRLFAWLLGIVTVVFLTAGTGLSAGWPPAGSAKCGGPPTRSPAVHAATAWPGGLRSACAPTLSRALRVPLTVTPRWGPTTADRQSTCACRSPTSTCSSCQGQDADSQADQEYLRDIGYRPNVNQLRHEPMPASTFADRGAEAVRRNEEAAAASAQAQPPRGSRSFEEDANEKPADAQGSPDDAQGLAERWQESQEEWRHRLRSPSG